MVSLYLQANTFDIRKKFIQDFEIKFKKAVPIEVPDYIFLGNVSKGEETDKAKIYVNNTGNVNVTITPQLKDLSDEIFRNLYFQNRQTGNNSAIRRIGNYNF